MAVWFFSGQRLGQEVQGQGAAPDDGQADDCADAHGAQRLQGRGQRRGGQEPALPLRHVRQDGLQLEVRADDPADVENLVAVPDVVEVSWCESLGQVAGEDEAGEEGQGGVFVVQQDGSVCASLCRAHVQPVEERDAVKEVRVGKGQGAGCLAEPRPLHLQKPRGKQRKYFMWQMS